MLYAEAFAGSNNKEFVVELYKDARLLETAAPAMYEALQAMIVEWDRHGCCDSRDVVYRAQQALAQAEGGGHE